MKKLLAACCFILCLTITQKMVSAASYDHQVEAKDITFSWTIDGDTLHGKISAKTEGWVGVGFNPTQKMKDANIVIGYVKDGKAEIMDHYGDKATGHTEDDKDGGTNDVSLVSGSEENGYTTIEFTIPMNSGDKYDNALSADGDTTLMLAYGPNRDSFRPRHQYRTEMMVNLGTGASK